MIGTISTDDSFSLAVSVTDNGAPLVLTGAVLTARAEGPGGAERLLTAAATGPGVVQVSALPATFTAGLWRILLKVALPDGATQTVLDDTLTVTPAPQTDAQRQTLRLPLLLTLPELRLQARTDSEADDPALLAFAAAAQEYIEQMTGHALTRRAEVIRDVQFPPEGWKIARHPVNAVTAINYTDAAGAQQILPSSVWVLVPGFVSVLRRRTGQQWPEIQPDSEISIQLDVGYPIGGCPHPLRQACLMLASHFHANREPVNIGSSAVDLPFSVAALISSYRTLSFA
jgi:uncharacterized phiE125 gp8 family phage protein